MPERLELELRALGRELALPPAPDVAPRVTALLRAEGPPGGRPRPRRPLAIALAVLAVALAAALAVPPVRGALLDLFGIGGVTVERVEQLPPVRPGAGLALGRRVSLAEARRQVGFDVLAPPADAWGAPDGVFVARRFPGGVVSLLYGTEQRPRLLVTAFRGTASPDLVKKMVGGKTRISFVRVRGSDGVFLSGAPHAVLFRDSEGVVREDRFRLARDVLLWTRGGVTYRIEGAFDLDRALAIALSLR